jgi:glucan phosphoethanolaminetransferase (alkaline phosphatase superfamily)
MRRKPVVLAVSLIVIIFLPIVMFGLMASVNEYRDQGIGGAVDCNGPLTVMIFVVPSLVVYAAGIIYYAALLKGAGRSLPVVALLVLCAVMLFAAGGKAWAAYHEKNRPEHRQTCGEGW